MNTASKKISKVVEVKVPTDIRKVISSSPSTEAKWNELTPIGRRDFISWVESAKLEETRKRRVERIPNMLKSGKRRPCCYAIVPMGLYKALGKSTKAKEAWSKLSPDEKRDLSDSVERIKDKDSKRERIEKVFEMLARGKLNL